jgi:hypothetical protein
MYAAAVSMFHLTLCSSLTVSIYRAVHAVVPSLAEGQGGIAGLQA